jgi:hypothetical protein
VASGSVKRLSTDCQATVNIGEYSRGGLTRGDNQASDHDMGCKEKYVPCGIVDEDSAELTITFGSSYKTSDFIVDGLAARWDALDEHEKAACSSGKKKAHTVKNVLLVNALLTILFLSDTYGGRVHEKRMADVTPYPLPAGSRLLPDLGFLACTLPWQPMVSSG